MRKTARLYTGSALLYSAGQRMLGAVIVIVLMWLLSAWALGWV
ncbi:hypothetical protein ACBP93_00365 [Paenalcaligenes hominis]|uniref:Uncharacterized protein n=1 Tax=Paenalcaligenes hominis TaxID=643674 RepID=A0ABX0WP01_9BURK|nr:hypothetical protein [Paenalcaligenes hominis]NJB64913.1 hypothetical protein [Paenalcaligenes hominis]